MKHIAVLQVSSGPECLFATQGVLKFFEDNGKEVLLEDAKPGSERARVIWIAATGKFGNRKQSGCPLVVVLSDNDTALWAAANPSDSELREALAFAIAD